MSNSAPATTMVSTVPIAISPRLASSGVISPLQYGQFVEYLADVVPGMWAEKLSDCSFEGLGTWDWNFIKETDGVDRPWYPAAQVNRATFALDPVNPVSGTVSQSIITTGTTPCTVGLAQDGLAFKASEVLTFSGWFRGQTRDERVVIELLDRDGTVARSDIAVTGTWIKHTTTLMPSRGSVTGTIRICFKGPGSLWIDNVSLMPGDAVHGWRRDVFEAVRALKPGVIRYGGCAVDNTSDPRHLAWDWHDTLGDPDRRKPFWAWGGIQHTGPGLEELVRLIRAVGAEPMMTVRVSKRTASDAADMVEYFNGSAVTPMGKRRAENGHAEPYDIRYWQVGNELGGDAYEAVLPVFCSAMRAVDPGIILLSSFPTDKTVAAGGGQLDYLCPHHYRIGDYAATSADLDVNARRCSASARPVKIAVTEWNVTATDPGLARAKLWSLSGALTCARYRNMLNRRCDMVEIANRSNLINSICAGAIQTDRSRLFVTPTYHVDRLFATLAGNRVLTLAAPATTALDINATYRSGDEPMITIITVNPSLEDVASRVDLSGFTLLSGVIRIWTLADRDRAGEPEVVNSFRDPERIAPVEAMVKLTDGVISYTFPALSLVMMRCPVAAIAVSDG